MWYKPASGGNGGGSMWNDRGDVAVADFDQGDLTREGSGTLDLSAIVGANQVLVVIRGYFSSTAGGDEMIMKTNGNSNAMNVSKFESLGAVTHAEHTFIVQTDENGVVAYDMYIPGVSGIQIVVQGWFS